MAMSVSSDRQLCAAAATGGRTLLWSLADRAPWAELGDGHSAMLFALFSPDAAYLLTTQADGVVNLWSMNLDEAASKASPDLVRPPQDSSSDD